MRFLERHPQCAFVFSRSRVIDAHGRELRVNDPELDPGVHDSPSFIRHALERGNVVTSASVLVRRSAYAAAGSAYRPALVVGYDYEMWVRLAARSPVGYLDVADVDYRLHPGQATHAPPDCAERVRLLDHVEALLAQALPDLSFGSHYPSLRRARGLLGAALDAAEEGDNLAARGYLRRALALRPLVALRPAVPAVLATDALGEAGEKALTLRGRSWARTARVRLASARGPGRRAGIARYVAAHRCRPSSSPPTCSGSGGTEKGMTTQALALDRERFDVRILGRARLGSAAAPLEAGGSARGRRRRPAETLVGAAARRRRRRAPAPGATPSRSCRRPAARAGVPHLVDWNIFGQVDRSAGRAAVRMPPVHQQDVQLRYRRRVRDRRRRASTTATGSTTSRSTPRCATAPPTAREARRRLGLDPDRPVVGRTGRAADLKWRNLLVDMVPRLLRGVPDAQLLFVGATPAKVERLRRLGVLDRCTLVEQTLDEDRLAAFYAACDVFVSASEIGEAQGLANLEAMSLGRRRSVTCSTPWADNAQVEFVEHGRTGLIANHPRPFAEAVAALLLDTGLRDRLGADARARTCAALFDPARPGAPARAAVHGPAERGRLPRRVDAEPGRGRCVRAEYARRERLQYRPLRLRERVGGPGERLRERAARALRDRVGPS